MLPALALVTALLAPTSATTDTAYGRLEGDLGVAVSVGAAIGPTGVRAEADLRIRLLESIGWFGGYEDRLRSAPGPIRAFYTGMELRPLVPARWLKGLEFGHRFFDLCLDSLGLELGAFASQGGAESSLTRAGLQLGLGVEAPLSGQVAGAWLALHGGLRISDASLTGSAGGGEQGGLYVSVTLAWHAMFATHVVDAGGFGPK